MVNLFSFGRHVIDRAYARPSVQTLGEGDGRVRKGREGSLASLRRGWALCVMTSDFKI